MSEQQTIDAEDGPSTQEDPTPPNRSTLRIGASDEREWHEMPPDPQPLLYAALAKAQGAFPAIPRDRTVRVQTKTGGAYTFAYAPLDTILAKVRPALTENGLGLTQLFEGERLVTLVFHEGGGTMTSELLLPRQGSSWQEYGSAITYARRYAITALLGIASEEDDDGNAASGNVATEQKGAAKGATQSRSRTTTEKPAPAEGEGKTGSGQRMAHKRHTDLIHASRKRLADAGLLTDKVYYAVLKNEYGVEHGHELTATQAQNLIDRLKKYEAAIPKAAAEPEAAEA